jgi:single-strand DNA-binding protein
MSSVNKVFLIGNLGRELEIRQLEEGKLIAKFPVATSEYHRNKEGQKVEQTEWHHIVAFRNLAESIEKLHLQKGQLVCVEGRIHSRTYDDRDGHKKSIVEIIADNLSVLGKRMDAASHPQEPEEPKI